MVTKRFKEREDKEKSALSTLGGYESYNKGEVLKGEGRCFTLGLLRGLRNKRGGIDLNKLKGKNTQRGTKPLPLNICNGRVSSCNVYFCTFKT